MDVCDDRALSILETVQYCDHSCECISENFWSDEKKEILNDIKLIIKSLPSLGRIFTTIGNFSSIGNTVVYSDSEIVHLPARVYLDGRNTSVQYTYEITKLQEVKPASIKILYKLKFGKKIIETIRCRVHIYYFA